MFHPNVYNDGSICLDILSHMWSPVYDVSSILTSIQSLLTDPNPNSPAQQVASQMYQHNYTEYCRRVKLCVEKSQEECDEDVSSEEKEEEEEEEKT